MSPFSEQRLRRRGGSGATEDPPVASLVLPSRQQALHQPEHPRVDGQQAQIPVIWPLPPLSPQLQEKRGGVRSRDGLPGIRSCFLAEVSPCQGGRWSPCALWRGRVRRCDSPQRTRGRDVLGDVVDDDRDDLAATTPGDRWVDLPDFARVPAGIPLEDVEQSKRIVTAAPLLGDSKRLLAS